MTGAARPSRDRHIVTVWNPSYAHDAIEEHLAILLHFTRRFDGGEDDEDALYVWWGKVRSQNRQQPQSHLDDVRAIAAELSSESRDEVQLYLTDYRSLYVAEVLEIREGDLPASESPHVPAYYREAPLACDYWFRLGDIRRIVVDNTLDVIAELRKLQNIHYNGRPVSLYGGMVDLPLFVLRPDGKRYFDPVESEALTDGALWAEVDAERGTGVWAIERELRDNLLGEPAWSALERTASSCIATGEQIFREHRSDPAFDFAPVIGSFGKALEVQVNAILRRSLSRVSNAAKLVNLDGRTEDLERFRPLMLQELARVIGGERQLNEELCRLLANGQWFTSSLPPTLDAFRAVRNPGTHESRIERRVATEWRNRLLGVGCAGDFVELARVRLR
jgi:hypothetical protein